MSLFLPCFAKFGYRITELLLLEGTSSFNHPAKAGTLQVFNYKLYYIDE